MSADLARAESLFRRGDYLQAYDIAHSSVSAGDETRGMRYLEVLSAARLGNLTEALRLYAARGLDREEDLDSRVLQARLLKDQAFRLSGEARTSRLRDAAQAYEAAFWKTKNSFPGVNAASLWMLVGEQQKGRRIAHKLLAKLTADEDVNYYDAATRAEALLVTGRLKEARTAAKRAVKLSAGDVASRASTVTQLVRLAPVLPGAAELADVLRPPTTMMFCGHIFLSEQDTEQALAAQIDLALAEERVGFAYGAIAAGADILIAERALAADLELHVVLPFAERDFLKVSVEPAGADWTTRYEAVKLRAASVTFATQSSYVGDPAQFAYGADVAMGMTRLRARHLFTRSIQLALWDGSPAGVAGTGRDVERWRSTKGTTRVLDGRSLSRPPKTKAQSERLKREFKALLFSDFPGFSLLDEETLPRFWSEIMGTAASVLYKHDSDIDSRNTWGDAIFAVIDSAATAADVALGIQEALSRVDPKHLGLKSPPFMRISLHCGPVYCGHDPVTGQVSFYGVEVSRAARVEPITPPGSVYVSEPLAAILALEALDQFRSSFVGTVQLPKGFGSFPVYSLERAVPE